MSYYGYADFDRPIETDVGKIYYPFGGGAFVLSPHGCSLGIANDGRAEFTLDLIRSLSPFSSQAAYAQLEIMLNAAYASDDALAHLRKLHSQAVLSQGALTNWELRLLPGPAILDLPDELLGSMQLAFNNLGTARLVLRLSIESGLAIESLLQAGSTPVNAVAEAEMTGVSPRVTAVVRFRVSELLPILLDLASPDRLISRQALVHFFSGDHRNLPLTVSGQINSDQAIAFGEAMTDRIAMYFGSYVSSDNSTLEPMIRLNVEREGERDLIWSLSQPFLASRRLAFPFDLLSDVREQVEQFGIDAFIRRHTASPLPSLGKSNVIVFCTLPSQRIGVAALGATLSFPPKAPHRPHAETVTVFLEPPDDLVQAPVQLAPGEALQYSVSTFVVIADEQGVREIEGETKSYTGSTLRLSPHDFPIDFVMIEASEDLTALALISGICRYEQSGKSYTIPFTLDSGRLSISLALPKGSDEIHVECLAIARDGSGALRLEPMESPYIRLDLSSFAQYGWHETEIECTFEENGSIHAIEVLPVGLAETFENITLLAFTPDQPRRRFGWFAASPFRAGFLYRSHRDREAPGVWREVPSPVARVVISPEQIEPIVESEVVALSEATPRRPNYVSVRAVSETAETGTSRFPEGSPISPEAEPTDLLLYTHPTDSSKKFYVPRYWIDVQTVSGQQRYRISMTEQSGSSMLTIHLVKGVPEPLRDVARGADEYPHDIAISLSFLQSPPSGARKTLSFQDIHYNGSVVSASTTFATLQERDEVFRALTEFNRDARLIVKRSIQVAIPYAAPPNVDTTVNWVDTLDILLPPRPLTTRLDPILFTLNPVTDNLRTTLSESSLVVAQPRPDLLGTRLNTVNLRPVFPPIDDIPILQPIDIEPRLPRPRDIIIVNRTLPTPELAYTGQGRRTVSGNELIKVTLSVTNWEAFSADYFKASPALPPCGANTNASRTWVSIFDANTDKQLYSFCALSSPSDLTNLWFAIPTSQRLPRQVYVKMEDRAAKVVRKSNVVEIKEPEPSPPLYQQTNRELEHLVQPVPFAFPLNLHGYMFQGIVPGSEGSGLVRFRLQWKGRYHTYLQDASRPNLVYYFPDQFKIARRREAPFTPFVTVRVMSNGSTSDTDVVFDYIVAPYTEPSRLRQAREALLANPGYGMSNVEFQPFLTSDVRFFIDRPTERGIVREERSDAALVLQGSLRDSLVMKLPDFGILFEAMYRDTASLFLGRIEIDVPGESAEVIPFTARMDDLVGELFVYTAVAKSDGTFDVILLNAIESPLQINALDAYVSVGGSSVGAAIRDITFPIEQLTPGARMQMTVAPDAVFIEAESLELRFNVENIKVLIDPAAVWDAILDRSTLEYFNIVTVKAIPSLFEPVAGRENDQIVAILVEFEGGGTAELNASQLEAQVRIDYPIDDVLLRRAIDPTYRYTVTVIRVDGRQEQDAEPRQKNSTSFYVNVQR